jgi:branched-chain amino acid transport system ATP-binding protein
MSLGLAPVVVDQLLGVLADTRKEGVTVLLVEQDVFAAFSVADRGYVMETGHIVRAGPVKELERDPEVRRAYLGVAKGQVRSAVIASPARASPAAMSKAAS